MNIVLIIRLRSMGSGETVVSKIGILPVKGKKENVAI